MEGQCVTSERKCKLVFYPFAALIVASIPVVTTVKLFHLGDNLKALWFFVWIIHPTATLSWLFYAGLAVLTSLWLHARYKRLHATTFNGWSIVLAVAAYAAVGILLYPIMTTAALNPLFAAGHGIYAHGWTSLVGAVLIIVIASAFRLWYASDKRKARRQSRLMFDPKKFDTIEDHPLLLEAYHKERH